MTIYHIDDTQTLLIAGPAKIDLVSDFAPAIGQAETPTTTSLAPASAVAGDAADIEMVVNGTGFNELSKIVFNGNDEPTTMLSPTQVRTIVKPSIFVVAADVPVAVRNGSLTSNAQIFSFTEPAGRSGRSKSR